MPKVSVILPAWNASITIARVLGAILAQDEPDFEIIVCDDGSSDGTADTCREFAEQDARIRLVTCGHAGVSAARNAGMDRACGAFVAFCDADDVPHPDWLSSMLALVEGVDLAACGYDAVDCVGRRQYGTEPLVPAEPQTRSAHEFTCDLFSNSLMYQGYVWNKLFRRELIERDEPLRFRTGITQNEDRLFVYEYLKRCDLVAVEGTARYSYFLSAPHGYKSSNVTELLAFHEMERDLAFRALSGEPVDDALFFLGKDVFRACVELLWAAHEAESLDTLRLKEHIDGLSGYRHCFANYPAEFQEKLAWALGETEATFGD